MNLNDSSKKTLKEEITIPIGARRNLGQLEDYILYELSSTKKYVHKFMNKQRFYNHFMSELYERFYQGWLSNNIGRHTDEFYVMQKYVRDYVFNNYIHKLNKIWFDIHIKT